MQKSERALRHERALGMSADNPTLVPNVRTLTFIDYQSLTPADVSKCDRQIEEFKRTGAISCPTSNAYFKIMVVLRERRRLLSSAADLLEAGEVDNLIREISDFFLENKLYTGKSDKVDTHQAELDTEAQRHRELEGKWGDDRCAIHQRRDAAQQRVADATAGHLSAYDGAMPAALPPEWTRLSADLLDLREREKHLIGSRRFQEADALHKEFERRQKEELQRRREEYFQHFEKERAVLERRNERRRRSVADHWGNHVDHFTHEMNRELQPLRKGVGHLTSKVACSKAEYIGEDDPILRDESYLTEARDGGNIYRRTRALTRSVHPRSMVATRREILRPQPMTTTRQLSEAQYRQSAETVWRIPRIGR
jgi:hypothetical protein